MSRKILLVLLLLLLLSGCGRKKEEELQRFEGEIVATLQTPGISLDQIYGTETTQPFQSTEETPQPSQFIPTLTPVVATDATSTIPQPTQQPYGFENTTLAPLASNTPVFSMTPTSTLGMGVWEGHWNIWYQNSRGNYSSSVMTVQIAGTQFSASATIDNINYSFKGRVILQGSEVEGEWKTLQTEGDFWLQMVSSDSFVGSREVRFGFCGNREDVERPDLCRKLPSN